MQLESSTGNLPFLVEGDDSDARDLPAALRGPVPLVARGLGLAPAPAKQDRCTRRHRRPLARAPRARCYRDSHVPQVSGNALDRPLTDRLLAGGCTTSVRLKWNPGLLPLIHTKEHIADHFFQQFQ